jgi:membrane carboxypeptidase/penicillin-binding protein
MAYTTFADSGRVPRPRSILRAYLPGGGRRFTRAGGRRRAASPASAYIVHDHLRRADGPEGGFGKTGTSSDLRDAWYAGGAGSLVAVVWVGLDDNSPLGLGGAAAAEPIWEAFVGAAAPMLGGEGPARPARLVRHWVDPTSGLRLGRRRAGAESYWFRRGDRPARRRLWRRESSLAPIE